MNNETPESEITCLCLETFVDDGKRPFVRLTPKHTVDSEGRSIETSMVCCNDCWLKMGMIERGILSLLMTPAAHGGLRIGMLLAERLWPKFMQSSQVAAGSQEAQDAERPTPPVTVDQTSTFPPGQQISAMLKARRDRRESPG